MLNSNKKQFLIIIIFLFMFFIIFIYFFKIYNSNYEYIDSENILENITETISNESINTEITNKIEINYIVVHITGAINTPGIVKLPLESRISDAINEAGGLTSEADISSINLAYKLEDGQKIYIPYITDDFNSIISENYITSDAGYNIVLDNTSYLGNNYSNIDLININIATQTELETIPGIGPTTALKIIQYRNENGKFATIEDIKNINGIGESKFENIKKYITIK